MKTGQTLDDGASILYVNGAYRGDDPIGRLMHDFNCTSADEMKHSEMSERTRYLKERTKQVQEISGDRSGLPEVSVV